MPGPVLKIPRPETLYYVWEAGWAIGGACLLWTSRATLRKEPDRRTGWSGSNTAVTAFFVIYAAAWLINIGLTAGLARELARFVPEARGIERALFMLFNPALMALVLLGLRRYASEFSPQRPHRVKPAGEFGFTPAGIVRGFAGAMAVVSAAGLRWGGALWLVNFAGLGDYTKSQDSVAFISGAADWRVIVPFVLGAAVFAPIHEELFYRAGVFAVLRERLPRIAAYAACGAVFGLVHFNAFAFLPLAVFGAWLAFLYDSTADIRVPVTVHALFNLSTVVWAVLAPGAVN